jgi:pentatricopeptide repeat-containing protein PET309
MHGTLDTTVLLDHARSPSLNASAFLLDFLYPTGAVAMMRRLTPVFPDQSDRLRYRSQASHVSPRLFNSSASRQQLGLLTPPVEEQRQSHSAGAIRGIGKGDADELTEPPEPKPFVTLDTQNPAVTIEHILKSENLDEVDVLWRHYKSLDHQTQDAYLRPILVFLSRTGRVSDSWKISELFYRLDTSSWDNDIFVTGVAAEINLQNLSQALSVFEQGLRSVALDNTSLVDALDLLLASAFKSATADFLERIWKLYPEMAIRWEFDGIISDLKHLASVPGIAERAAEFPNYMAERLSDPSSNETDREALEVLQKILVRKALCSCDDSQAVPLLLLTRDQFAFEDYLITASKKVKKKTLTEVYAIYRDLPGSKPSHAVLHCVFNAYVRMQTSFPKIIAGVELLWDDWHRFHVVPSRRAYQRHLAFHAARGNKERVYSLWTEYIERFRDDPTVDILNGNDTFSHLLQVHAVNAEPEEAQRIFNDMINKFKIHPDIYEWNILLNAYVKANDYDGAIGTFDSLCAATTPDKYSYGTLMQMVGSRGDLGFAVDLYRRARSSKIVANGAMLSSLVDAYCLNDHFQEAEDVCTRAANKGIVVTLMWNKLLHHNALRRDLASINSILNTMADKNIPYNQFTYQQLLLGLALCRQSQHALHLLTVALKENVFEVTPAHFKIVMGALLRTGEPGPVRRLFLLMKEHGISITSDIIFRLSQALLKWKSLSPKAQRQRSRSQWVSNALRAFFQIYGVDSDFKASPSASANRVRSKELLRSGREVYQFGTMMYVFAELNDSVRVNELTELYRHLFQATSDDEGILPLPMLDAVMLSALHDKQYDRVKATWQLIFEQASKEGRSANFNEDLPDINKISPRYRYALSGCLRLMQETLFKEGDSVGLQGLVKKVLEAGFGVDSRNWNYHVQTLAQMKEYKAAFVVCEKVLMQNWTGWYTVRSKEAMRNNLPLDTRRKGSSPRYLRPTATTLYRLAQAYLELDRLSPWSGEAANIHREVESECQQVVRAIKSMIRVHSELEEEIFGSSEFADTINANELDREEADPEAEAEEVGRPLSLCA